MKQLVCIVTILTLFLQLASCSKDLLHTKVRTVQKDSEWWNETETVVTPEEIMRTVGDKAHDVFCHLLSYDEDSAILDFQVYAKKGEDISVYHLIRKYSYEDGLSGEIKLEDESYPDCVFISGGKYFAVICNYSENEKKFTLECFEMDFENGNLGVKIPFNVPEDKYPFLSVNGIISYENKRIYILHSTDLYGEGQYRVCVDDGSKVRSIIPEFGNNVKLESLYNLMLIDNKPVFLATVTENDRFKQQLCTVDISTMTIEISEVSQDIDVEMAQYVPGKGLFNCDNKKIYRIDLLSGSENEVMDLRNSYIGGSFDSEERVLYSSEDKTVIFAEEQALSGGMSTAHIILFKKAEDNPNAGKKILTLASLDYTSQDVWKAVSGFNRDSDKYFLEVSDKYYDAAMGIWKKENFRFDWNLILASEADAVNLLMTDIREGTGPDLVIYNRNSAQLNSTDYLIDLTKRIRSEQSLNSGDYMGFILQPNGSDGKHYRLDYEFSVEGLAVMNAFIGDDAKGLTFEEYDQLIKTYNDGKSVLPETDTYLLETLIKTNDCVSHDDSTKFGIDNESFRRISEYIASVPDVMQYDNVMGQTNKRIQMIRNMTGIEFSRYYGMSFKDYSIVGLPSADGHAETINGKGIGITACCPLQDGAWEFVMKMMSPEIQVAVSADPVLISVQKAVFEEYIEINNLQDSGGYRGGSFSISKEMVDWYVDQISDAVIVPDTDSAVIVIMNEEMPAYFEGQKSLDDVIGIIENRVNLMLNERA